MKKSTFMAGALTLAASAVLAGPVLHAGKPAPKAAAAKAGTTAMKCPYLSGSAGAASPAAAPKSATGDNCCAGMAGAHGAMGRDKVSGTPPPQCPMFGAKAAAPPATHAHAGKAGHMTARKSK